MGRFEDKSLSSLLTQMPSSARQFLATLIETTLVVGFVASVFISAERFGGLWAIVAITLMILRAAISYSEVSFQAKQQEQISVLLQSTRQIEERVAFNREVLNWESETKHVSSLSARKRNAHYDSIVRLGDAAVPLILEYIQRQPSWIVIALPELTGTNAVRQESEGKLSLMCDDWLQWGRRNDEKRRSA